jgi:hypothetical protein
MKFFLSMNNKNVLDLFCVELKALSFKHSD